MICVRHQSRVGLRMPLPAQGMLWTAAQTEVAEAAEEEGGVVLAACIARAGQSTSEPNDRGLFT